MADPEADMLANVKYEKEPRHQPFELTFYLMVAIIGATVFTFAMSGTPRWIFLLSTSPFNISFEGNVVGNFAIPLAIFASAELYLRSTKRDKLILNLFVSSVLSTYIIAIYNFLTLDIVDSGTSIVAFSVFVLLIAIAFLDLLKWTKINAIDNHYFINLIWLFLVLVCAALVVQYAANVDSCTD
ncbi:MAG: hypothetical protein M1504_00440, partial [Candidatus Marsarchaeota archaeon]|nr:hypothetical protein [Candidatus Marsarchaeota archaeon]